MCEGCVIEIKLFLTEVCQPFEVTNLVCSGRKVIVGTSIGSVGVFDSETLDVLQSFNWHKDKVCMLFPMPRQVEPCICAEVPFPDPECDYGNDKTEMESSPSIREKRYFPKQAKLENSTSEPESTMITSIGNGRCSYSIHKQSKEGKAQFNGAAEHKPTYKQGGKLQAYDIVLRTWRL